MCGCIRRMGLTRLGHPHGRLESGVTANGTPYGARTKSSRISRGAICGMHVPRGPERYRAYRRGPSLSPVRMPEQIQRDAFELRLEQAFPPLARPAAPKQPTLPASGVQLSVVTRPVLASGAAADVPALGGRPSTPNMVADPWCVSTVHRVQVVWIPQQALRPERARDGHGELSRGSGRLRAGNMDCSMPATQNERRCARSLTSRTAQARSRVVRST